MFLSANPPYPIQFHPILAEESLLTLSKQRIIQKNLVHFQGFPDSIYDKDLLLSPEYFGQYGNIIKIVLVSKEDKIIKKKTNSAYLTFETKEQAAYCILSVDSIKINNQLVRAFFGTTKYCNHFLNNYHCFNEEKCMFLHHIAKASDIINENTKFGYSDHIKLAKKIIGFGSFQSKYYVMNHFSKIKTILPNIKSIYYKEDANIINTQDKNNNHRRLSSNSSNNSTTNNSTNRSNNHTISVSPTKKENSKNDSSEIIKSENMLNNKTMNSNINNNMIFDSFKSVKKSRFFNIGDEYDIVETFESKTLSTIAESILKRKLFFTKFKKYKQLPLLKELENNYCYNLYKNTNDSNIKLLLENKF